MKFKKLYGGNNSSGPAPVDPYNPASDPGYQAAQALLAQLAPQMTAANTKKSSAQIMAELPAILQQLLAAQATPSATPNMSSWGNIANTSPKSTSGSINPVYAPQSGNSLFNGSGAYQPVDAATNYVTQAAKLGTAIANSGSK